MPVLSSNRPTKTITFPSYPDSKVEVYDSLLVGDIVGQNFKEPTVEQALDWMPKLIKSWNFTDEKGNLMPINSDSVKLFKANDIQYLIEEISKFSQEIKKGLASSQG